MWESQRTRMRLSVPAGAPGWSDNVASVNGWGMFRALLGTPIRPIGRKTKDPTICWTDNVATVATGFITWLMKKVGCTWPDEEKAASPQIEQPIGEQIVPIQPPHFVTLNSKKDFRDWQYLQVRRDIWRSMWLNGKSMIDRGLRWRGQRVWGKLEFAQGCSWIWGMRGLGAMVRPKEFQWDLLNLNEAFWASFEDYISI